MYLGFVRYAIGAQQSLPGDIEYVDRRDMLNWAEKQAIVELWS